MNRHDKTNIAGCNSGTWTLTAAEHTVTSTGDSITLNFSTAGTYNATIMYNNALISLAGPSGGPIEVRRRRKQANVFMFQFVVVSENVNLTAIANVLNHTSPHSHTSALDDSDACPLIVPRDNTWQLELAVAEGGKSWK